jgi:hypothetical protein
MVQKIEPVGFPELEYMEAKTEYTKAIAASARADKRLVKAAEDYSRAKAARNAALPEGWYAESDQVADDSDFPIYLKRNGEWLWNGYGNGFTYPDWINDGDEFDIDVIPLSEVH